MCVWRPRSHENRSELSILAAGAIKPAAWRRLIWQNGNRSRWLKPENRGERPTGCMGTLSGALAFPGIGSKVAAKSRVDYQNTPEGVLARRDQVVVEPQDVRLCL